MQYRRSLMTWFARCMLPRHLVRWLPALGGWSAVLALIAIAVGSYGGLVLAPNDYQQGGAFRIMYVHVPCAAWSLACYAGMALAGATHLIWRVKQADWLLQALAPVGACLTLQALVTGAIWGKPMWGTWWVWDARLTSELVLFWLVVAVMVARRSERLTTQPSRAAAWVAVVGAIDLPVIHGSVQWWQTLHQANSVLALGPRTIAWSMLWPLLWMLGGVGLGVISVTSYRLRTLVVRACHEQAWCRAWFDGSKEGRA